MSTPRSFSRSLPRCAPGGRFCSSRGVMKCSSSAMILILRSFDAGCFDACRDPSHTIGQRRHRQTGGIASRMHRTVYAGLPTGLPMDTVPPSILTVARMSDAPIAAIELHHVALPTRREHKWTGLTEPIGGYV